VPLRDTGKGVCFVPLRDTKGGWFFGVPFVPLRDTPCVPQGHGILFFAALGSIPKFLAIPLLKVPRGRVRSMRKLGETVPVGLAAAVNPKEAALGLPQEAIMLILGVPPDDGACGLGA
jgi:hypothetical protein